MTSMRDDQPASQVMVGDELNEVAVRGSGCFFEQADVQSLLEVHAPTISKCFCGSTVRSERRQ